MLERLFEEMLHWDSACPNRIQHFVKVHAFALRIGLAEGLAPETLLTLEAAAYVHDIGIKPALAKYGSDAGPYQEELGPPEARSMLERLGAPPALTDRVCYLVAHHHTYTDIDGLDYQILVEADFLVNLYENHSPSSAVQAACNNIFRTESGKALCRLMFGL